MLFKLFIPAISQDGYNVRLKVEADNWIAALRQGLSSLGEQGDIVKNVMCDVQDDGSIHVTDMRTGRVFQINELVGDSAEIPAIAIDVGDADGEAPTIAPGVHSAETVLDNPAVTPAAPTLEDTRPTLPMPSAQATSAERSIEADPSAQVLEAVQEAATAESVLAARTAVRDPEELLAEVFEEASNIWDFGEDIQGATDFVMDVAMEKVDAEAGSILFANINENDMYFATARGPKAAEVMGFRVPMGKGIVGFCAANGQTVSVSNAPRSPFFFKKIAESVGYPARSIACAPVEHDGRSYGAIEVLNKNGSDQFGQAEVEALKYLGARLAEHINTIVMANA